MRSLGKKVVAVAISGGVDSAVAAALLKAKGHDVRGVFLREYDLGKMVSGLIFVTRKSDLTPFSELTPFSVIECTQEGDRQSALAVAAALDIPFEEWDFRKEYERSVVRYMIREYKAGRTPNPDMMCNSVIKFGLFLKRALREGADFIATGHYARLGYRVQGSGYTLNAARDSSKDQTYFLATLTQEQLKHCLFPIGTLLKSEVRVKAKAFGLPNWNRKDSQGVCFIGKLSMKEFLKTAIKTKRGPLMTTNGERVGTHDGAAFFTIGQRHGIGFSGGGEPYYVVGKDMKKNIVYVDRQKPSSVLYQKELTCTHVNWISGQPPKFPFVCTARTRYRQPLQRCVVTKLRVTSYGLRVTFDSPQRAVTPGQFVVFYKGRECLGSGIIEE
ncbi:tRNA 2-thiouridine(34) synthase MnmA [Candidatus Uhrbacteria bacterium]|nr:tRNA 2-thiouridine(34) synthase MnmA [Candidatus Uhrbacteria bacterium]